MIITLNQRRLYIAWLPFLVVLLLLFTMCKLGLWQLDRAAQKKALLESVSNARQQKTEVIYKVPDDFSEWQYRKIQISGQYLKDKQFLLDNKFSGRPGDKRAGYEVLTPFLLQDDSAILVNRGWLPRQNSKAELPNVAIGNDIGAVKGIVRLPAKGFSLGDIHQTNSGWPKLIQYIDTEQLSVLSQQKLQPVTLMLLPEEKAGYERYWHNKNDIKMRPAIHYGYAFQWFALSVTLLILSIYIVIKKSEKVSNNG